MAEEFRVHVVDVEAGAISASLILKLDPDDLLPIFSARVKLVESVFSKENGREEAVFGRADHRVPEAG
jgi:hypothetical protein